MGNHDHVYWECAEVERVVVGANPELEARPEPADDWQRRLGWPLGTKESGKNDRRVSEWMRAVTPLIWEERYGSKEKKRYIDISIKRRKAKRQWEREAWLIREAKNEEAAGEQEEDEEEIVAAAEDNSMINSASITASVPDGSRTMSIRA